MAGILVTGTDTGVGKTAVACAIAASLAQRGLRVSAWKPVETGIEPGAEESSDAALLARAAASGEPPDSVCTYRLRAPLAPAVAARLEGITIDFAHLEQAYRQRAGRADAVIIEGAGGLLVPLAGRSTYVDLARRLAVPILIVTANRLGTINHTALTARVAAAEGLRVVGFVLNHPMPVPVALATPAAPGAVPSVRDLSPATNRDAIIEQTGLPCFGELPHVPDILEVLRSGPAPLGQHLDIEGILRALREA
jgi:dethiobiotin synthetase